MKRGEAIACGCCGRTIAHTPAENAYYGREPYPADLGVGLCRACGGDPDAQDVRERFGWALCTVVDVRIPLVAQRLSHAKRVRFLELPYEGQAVFVLRLMERGLLP